MNDRLHKPTFDCTKLDETYDCGCGDEKDGSEEEDETLVEGVSKDKVTNEGLQKGGADL